DFRWLLHRKVGRLLALENPAGVAAALAISLAKTDSVAHEAPRHGKLTEWEDRRQHVAGCKRDELFAPAVGDLLGDGNQRVRTLLHRDCENRLDFEVIAGIQHLKVSPERARGLLSRSRLRPFVRIVRVQ